MGLGGSAFEYLFNDMTFKQSMKKLWNRKGEIWSDAGQGLIGGGKGALQAIENAPIYAKLPLMHAGGIQWH